jgi:hypothetical protein
MPELHFSFTARTIKNSNLVIKTTRIGRERHLTGIWNIDRRYYRGCNAPSNIAVVNIQKVAAYAIVKALTKSHIVVTMDQQLEVSNNKFLVS